MAKSFSAQVAFYVAAYKNRMDAVFREAVQMTIEDAQRPRSKGGRMRVDTGFLRNTSFLTAINGQVDQKGGSGDDYVLTVARANAGDDIFAGWSAEYARPREYGSRGQPGDFFMRGAAQKWQDFVSEAAGKIVP